MSAQQQRQALIDDLERTINPPPAPEPEPSVIYIEQSEGSDTLGTADINPKLYAQPKRWG